MSFFLLYFFLAAANCGNIMESGGGQRFDLHLLNPKDNTRTACHLQSDCFNCTIADCTWQPKNKVCVGTNNNQNWGPSVSTLVSNAKTCGDPLNICEYSGTVNYTIGFGGHYNGSIPAGYICQFEFDVP